MMIREATVKDLSKIIELYSQSDMDDGKVPLIDDAKEIYLKMKTYPDYNIYVAEMENEIVGTFALAIMDNIAHMGSKSGLIEDVVVSQKYQGKGIGTQMMNYAIELCKEKSCYKVCLSSNLKRNNAHKFYEGIGFKKHGYSFLMEIE